MSEHYPHSFSSNVHDEDQPPLPFEDMEYVPTQLPTLEYGAEAPTNDAEVLLSANIYRSTRESSLMSRQFSQTPLVPSKLYELGKIAYPKAVEMLLVERIGHTSEESHLPGTYRDAIEFEIALESERRREGNDHAGEKLRQYLGGIELNDNDAELIWRARTGDASMAETAELLLRYPIMGAIEAAKHTEPLRWNGVSNTDIHIASGYDDFTNHISDASKVHAEWFTSTDERRNGRSIDPRKSIHDPERRQRQQVILGMKDNLAQITNGTTTIELVRKRTLIMLPDTVVLQGVKKVSKRVKSLNYEPINLQPIATSCYWRVIDTL